MKINYPKINYNLIFEKCYEHGIRLKSIVFDRTISLEKAFSEISMDKEIMEYFGDIKYFPQKTISRIKKDLSINNKLGEIEVTEMVDCGQTAFVFKTNDGNIIKITNRNHFLGRKPAKFDHEIITQGKLSPKSFCYYYLEEETANVSSSEEMHRLKNEIAKLGYKPIDYRIDQIGKNSKGELVLIDPECARKKGILGFLKYNFSKLKSYILILTN